LCAQRQGAEQRGWVVSVELYPGDVGRRLQLVAALRDVGVALPDEHRVVSVRRAALPAGLRVVALPDHRAQHQRADRARHTGTLQDQRRVGPRRYVLLSCVSLAERPDTVRIDTKKVTFSHIFFTERWARS